MAGLSDNTIIELMLQREESVAISPSTRVDAVMHRGLIACASDSSLLAVARIMAAHRIHSVVVAGSPLRIITDAEIGAALCQGGLATKRAEEIAKTAAVVARSDPLARATEVMREHMSTHAIVVDSRRSLNAVGVLSVLDIVEALIESEHL
jgi:predicted transcriptional regulator